MDWLALTPAVLVATAVLVVPGLVLSFAAGLRGMLALAVAAPVSATLIGGSAIVLVWAKIPWSVLSCAAVCCAVIVIVGAAWLASGVFGKRPTAGVLPTNWLSLLVGLFLATAGFWLALTTLYPSAGYFAQTFDNTFHLNVVRYILDTGQASSFTIGGLNSGGAPPAFYPGAYHAYLALVVQLTSLPIGTAQNATTLAAAIAGWGVGCLVLTQVVGGRSVAVSALVGLVLGSTFFFPWTFIWSGGLFPNLFGNVLVPGALTLVMLLAVPLRKESAKPGARFVEGPPMPNARPALTGERPRLLLVLGLVATVPGIGLAHPIAALTLLAAILVTGWVVWAQRLPLHGPALRWVLWAGCAVLLGAGTVGFGLMWTRLAPASPSAPPTLMTLPQTALVLLQGGSVPLAAPVPTLAVTVAILLGLVGAAVRRYFAPVVLSLAGGAAFVIAFSGPDPAMALAVGATMYNDIQRMAAAALILSLPVLAAGVGALMDALAWLVDGVTGRRWIAACLRGLVATAIGIPVALAVQNVLPQTQAAAVRFVIPSDASRFFTAEEYDLMGRVSQYVPAGEHVVADPGTGGAFIYAISGTPVVFPHIFVTDNPAMAQLRAHMFDKTQLPQTCAALEALHAHYFYSSGRAHPRNLTGPAYYPGLYNRPRAMLKLLATQGDGSLYRFVACDK